MINYMCNDLHTIMDITRPPDRIRQDPSAAPPAATAAHSSTTASAVTPAWIALAQALCLLQLRPDRAAAGLHARADAGEVRTSTPATFPYGFVTADDSWHQLLALGTECAARLEQLAAGQRQRRQVARAGNRQQPGSLPAARCRRYSRRCACGRPAMRPIAAPVAQITADFVRRLQHEDGRSPRPPSTAWASRSKPAPQFRRLP